MSTPFILIMNNIQPWMIESFHAEIYSNPLRVSLRIDKCFSTLPLRVPRLNAKSVSGPSSSEAEMLKCMNWIWLKSKRNRIRRLDCIIPTDIWLNLSQSWVNAYSAWYHVLLTRTLHTHNAHPLMTKHMTKVYFAKLNVNHCTNTQTA